jgi:hypothetical protein
MPHGVCCVVARTAPSSPASSSASAPLCGGCVGVALSDMAVPPLLFGDSTALLGEPQNLRTDGLFRISAPSARLTELKHKCAIPPRSLHRGCCVVAPIYIM